MVRINRIDVLSAANLVALIYMGLALVVTVPFTLAVLGLRTAGDVAQFAPAFLIFVVLAPLAAAVSAWVFTALAVVAYNLAARWTGGIAVQVSERRDAEDA